MSARNYLSEDRGFVLVTVLMGIAVLAGIATALTIASRTNIAFVNSHAELARAEFAADAGISLAIIRILAQPGQAATHDLELVCQFQDNMLSIAIADESGKVDLNAGSPQLITGLIAGILRDNARAMEIAEAIFDFVDQDDEDRLNKRSERERYTTIKGPAPKNTWFATIDELEQVPKLAEPLSDGRSLFQHVRPFVTVWSRRSGIDLNVASKELLELLGSANGGTPFEASLVSEARFFTIIAKAATPSGGRFSREVTIERDASSRHGYRLRNFLARPFVDDEIETVRTPAASTTSCLSLVPERLEALKLQIYDEIRPSQ